MTLKVHSRWLGSLEYGEALKLQLELSEQVRIDGQVRVLGLEHPDVVTLGPRARLDQDVLWSETQLKNRGIQFVETDRGGQATLHSQGQLVVYPLLPLAKFSLGVRQYVHLLQSATIDMLQSYGIESALGKEPGVYTAKGKIAFCGVRVERGVTRHGISINVQNNLNLFDCIVPCGIRTQVMDAMSAYDPRINLEEVFVRWSESFQRGLASPVENPKT